MIKMLLWHVADAVISLTTGLLSTSTSIVNKNMKTHQEKTKTDEVHDLVHTYEHDKDFF